VGWWLVSSSVQLSVGLVTKFRKLRLSGTLGRKSASSLEIEIPNFQAVKPRKQWKVLSIEVRVQVLGTIQKLWLWLVT
jgi:hypothetical protein